MSKKIYRSLFDSDDVFEVEELTDETVEEVEATDADEDNVSNRQLLDILKDILEAVKGGSKVTDSDQNENTGGSTKGCEPAGEMKVEPAKTVIDEDDEEKVEVEAEKEVKDAYSQFTRVGAVKDSANFIQSTQVAFQNRYNKVANK